MSKKNKKIEAEDLINKEETLNEGDTPVSYTHLTLPTICSV